MSGNKAARILHAEPALSRGFGKIAELLDNRKACAEEHQRQSRRNSQQAAVAHPANAAQTMPPASPPKSFAGSRAAPNVVRRSAARSRKRRYRSPIRRRAPIRGSRARSSRHRRATTSISKAAPPKARRTPSSEARDLASCPPPRRRCTPRAKHAEGERRRGERGRRNRDQDDADKHDAASGQNGRRGRAVPIPRP